MSPDPTHTSNEILSIFHREDHTSITVTGLRGGAKAMFAARAASITKRPVLCVVATELQVPIVEQDIALFTDVPTLPFPSYDIPPYTPLSPDPATVASRLASLYHMMNADTSFIIVVSAEALLRRLLPKKYVIELAELVIAGEETAPEKLVERLIAGGYEQVALVQTVGEFSVRGGIIDIFAPVHDHPIRLDFFGDTVESIRLFDPITQRSIEHLEECVFLPVSDILFPPSESKENEDLVERFSRERTKLSWNAERSGRILERITSGRKFSGMEFFLPLFYSSPSAFHDYLPKNALTVFFDDMEINRSFSLAWERINNNYETAQAASIPALPPETLFLSKSDIREKLAGTARLTLNDFPDPLGMQDGNKTDSLATSSFTLSSSGHDLIRQDLELRRKKQGILTPLTERIAEWLEQGDNVHIACRSSKRARHLAELFEQHDLPVSVLEAPILDFKIGNSKVLLYDQPLSQGFDLQTEQLHILSESELFGEKRLGAKKKIRRKAEGQPVRFEELKSGDIIVHRDHGLGRYEGLVNMVLAGIPNDFLQITYQGNDKLYVPVDRINTVSKYKGLSDKSPKIDRLGGKSWASAKKKVKEAVWLVAQDLLNLYARRHLEKGRAFSRPDELYYELEESFPFDETAGQIKAINEVIADLTSERPMDRLVCGDVGYGKTEVAVRAAYKVIADSRQVALLVPTTVLAEQHAETFQERFRGFPVRVESLNRFRTRAEQGEILKGMADGNVDLVIGTHRLLSKDVAFKRLGLLIIDEEHRFGVTHKEKLKKLRTKVDVLTLTATPIPRTLQLSLLGIRDLSVISTPPQERRSVKTFVAQHDDLVIKEAVIRELSRRGQVFLVHNRVRSIQETAAKVQKLVPNARVAVAHGQMHAKPLEEIMVRFVRKEIDVLVCTTIIESGLDIPNANTIIVTRADRLGLAEIYQLRGRVGRSREQAYAYLLMPSLESLSKDAKRRLRALMDYNELGGGFKLAMSDLQIRGGGNILGESQSGNIAAVGYDLYLDLLQKTVEDLKRKTALGEEATYEEEVDPEINLHLSAFIPEHYISDTDQRYIAYRKLTSLSAEEELLDLRDELNDRYGAIPRETDNLFALIGLKMELKKLKISKLEQGPSNLVFTFQETTPITPEKILFFINTSKNKVKFTPDSRLVVHTGPLNTPDKLFETAKKTLRAIMENAM